MNDDDIELDELFAAARDQRPPAGAEARGWARFEAGLGSAAAAPAASTKLAWLAPAAKLGGVVAVVLAIGVALSRGDDGPRAKRAAAADPSKASPIAQATPTTPEVAPDASPPPELSPPSAPTQSDARPRPSPATSRSSTPRLPATVDPVAPTEPAAAPTPEVVVVQRPAAISPSTPSVDSLRLEAELLGRAWVAIREGRAEATRALLAEHAEKFPDGALVPERHACQLVASCIAGDRDALDRARRYLDRHRASHLAARVATGCGLRAELPSEPVRSGDEAEPRAADGTR